MFPPAHGQRLYLKDNPAASRAQRLAGHWEHEEERGLVLPSGPRPPHETHQTLLPAPRAFSSAPGVPAPSQHPPHQGSQPVRMFF